MEDYIKREIDKIGKLIRAILQKIGVMRASATDQSIVEATKVELLEKLDLDLDAVLESEDFVTILVERHSFSPENLESFAELLFDLIAATADHTEKKKLAFNISALYKYLDSHSKSLSINRFYILKELPQYLHD